MREMKPYIKLLVIVILVSPAIANMFDVAPHFVTQVESRAMEDSTAWTSVYVYHGDLVIDELFIMENQEAVVNGRILIESGGVLIVRNSSIYINVSISGEYGIIVKNGGNITIYSSTITTLNTRYFYFELDKGSVGYISGANISHVGQGARGVSGIYIETDGVRIENSTIYSCTVGVYVSSASDIQIVGNKIEGNTYDGILIVNSSNVEVSMNNILYNGIGLRIISSTQIEVYFNNFIGNAVYDNGANDFDNQTYGNYWWSMERTDEDGDWICDSPYNIDDNSIDGKPLMYPFEAYIFRDRDYDGDGLNNSYEKTLGTNPYSTDTDGDYLSDDEEVATYNTDPRNADTDGDGMCDGWEVNYSFDPSDPSDADLDFDGDQLSNIQEYNNGTDPTNPDSDGDGMTDYWEVLNGTDPTNPDSDGDGMTDYWEVVYGLDPLGDDASQDNDADGLTNLEEFNIGTDPTSDDTDGDSLPDWNETKIYKTNATNPDTDGDGVDDGDEILTYGSDPTKVDSDDDGISDWDEINLYGTNPVSPDTDGDGLSDSDELFIYHTNTSSYDSDGDGMDDGWEIYYMLDPNDPDDANEDNDYDGLTNLEEYKLGTDPTKYDSDGDRFGDALELKHGYDPKKREVYPTSEPMFPIIIGAIVIFVAVVVIAIVMHKKLG